MDQLKPFSAYRRKDYVTPRSMREAYGRPVRLADDEGASWIDELANMVRCVKATLWIAVVLVASWLAFVVVT